MNKRHAIRVLAFAGKSRDLTSTLAASISALESGARFVPRHKLATDAQLAAVHAALEEILRPKGWVPTGRDVCEATMELLK